MAEVEDGGFAKIYGDRLEGSSLMECRVATRWCFLFMSSTSNRSGFFRCASVSVLARRANVTLEEAELAIQELEAPDPDSTTRDEDGRRIVRVQGGWDIVTHQFYRNLRSSKQIDAAERQQDKRDRDKYYQPSRDVTQRHAPSRGVSLEAEAEGEIEAEAEGEGSAPASEEIDPHAFTQELVAEIQRHLPDSGVGVHPGLTTAVANLLAVGHPKGPFAGNGDRIPLAREDIVDAVHGWILAEQSDSWHVAQRAKGEPFTLSRLLTHAFERLPDYAERGRAGWGRSIGGGLHGLEHERAPPVYEPVDPEITGRHLRREEERLEKLKAWREEKPPEGMSAREERGWWEKHKRSRP
jgi:hypothetical protein